MLLVLIFAYPLLQWLFVPVAYRQRYDQYPQHKMKFLAAGCYWGTVILPFLFASSFRVAILGVIIHLAGACLAVAAMRINPFFVPDATWLPEQFMVRRGVYRWLVHPGYAGMLLMCVGNVIALGVFAALPAIAYLSILLFHVRKENEVLNHYARL